MTPSTNGRAQFRVTRRQFVRTAGVGLTSASLANLLAARQAPAQIKGTTLRILTWSHFIPAYDIWFDKFAKEWGDKNGVKVRVDHIPHLEIPARMAAEFAAGAGHDIIFNGSTILTRLYYKTLADLTDIYDADRQEVRRLDPGRAGRPSRSEGRIYGIPIYYILAADDSGGRTCSTPTVSSRRTPGSWRGSPPARSSPRGIPTGIQFSQCNDANLNWRSLLFSFGGTETDPSGENVRRSTPRRCARRSGSPRRSSTRA